MNFLMMVRHVDLVRDLLDLAITWSVAMLKWVAPPASICAMVWRTSAAPRGDSSTPPAGRPPDS